MLEELKKTEIEIRQISVQLLNGEKKSTVNDLVKKKRKLDYEQETAVMNYLETKDKNFNFYVQENFDLLINDHIEFVVTTENSGLFKSHATRISGQVHDNGYFYGDTSETDLALFTKGFYPLNYKGLVNYFGEADVLVDKKGYKFFGSKVPQKYIGSIDSNGNVFFETTETFWELFGDIYVNSIIADFFSGNSEKRKKFMENKSMLKNIIRDFRQNL